MQVLNYHKNLAVINDATVAPTLTAAFDADSEAVNLSWTESGFTDTTYTITKTSGAISETIDVAAATSYVDNDIKSGNYTYTVTSNVEASSVGTYTVGKTSAEASVDVMLDDSTVSEIFKFHFKWDDDRNGSDTSFYIGEKNDWNDYGQNSTGGANLKGTHVELQINDSGYGDGVAEIRDADYTGKDWNKTNWGYAGEKFRYMSMAENPEEFWCNIYDASPIKDTGYAVFDIEPTVAEGIDTAYLALAAPHNEWAMACYDGVSGTDFSSAVYTKDAYSAKSDIYCTMVSGVKLTDYYDVEKGGRQVIAVPLSRFADSPDFLDSHSKTWSTTQAAIGEYTRFNLELLNGMGIVREDTDAENVVGFKANVYTMGVFNPQTPANFSASKEDNSVTLTWDLTTDTDTEYRIARTCNGETTYIDVDRDTSYVDADLNDGIYQYSIAVVNPTYGFATVESDPITVQIGIVDPVVSITEVNMGDYAGKAWDILIQAFNSAKSYVATFTDGEESKTGDIIFTGAEAEGGSVAFAIFLKTSRANVALDIAVQ